MRQRVTEIMKLSSHVICGVLLAFATACASEDIEDELEPAPSEASALTAPLLTSIADGYLPWEGAGITGGFSWPDGNYTLIFSKDRFWKIQLTTKVVLDSGLLATRAPWNQAVPVEGKMPWQDQGVTAVWTAGSVIGISSKRRYWQFDASTYTWRPGSSGTYEALLALPQHLFKAQPPIRCHAAWRGWGVTGGWMQAAGTEFVTISKNRFWRQLATAPYTVLEHGVLNTEAEKLRDGRFGPSLFKAPALPPTVDGQLPWDGDGITATWVLGNTLGITSVDKYWNYDLVTHTWAGAGKWSELPADHLFKKNVRPIVAGSACARAGAQSCSGNTINVCTRDHTVESVLTCGTGFNCVAGRCQNNTTEYKETVVLDFDSLAKVHGWFASDIYKPTIAHGLPPGASFDPASRTLTLTAKGGVLLAIPNPGDGLYRVEAELEDTSQVNASAFLTLVERLWVPGVPNRGLSSGINAVAGGSPATYWTQTTDAPPTGHAAYSRWVRRHRGWVRLVHQVTPAGIYPTIDGGNFSTLPDLAGASLIRGTYTLTRQLPGGPQMTYLALSKMDSGPSVFRFRNIRVVSEQDKSSALESRIIVENINGHFLKKAAESPALARYLADTSFQRGQSGMQRALWVAFLYRGYDYMFGNGAGNQARIQSLFERYLLTQGDLVEGGAAWLGCAGQPAGPANHDYINATQAHPYIVWGLRDRLTPPQIATAKERFKLTIDALLSKIKTNGSYPLNLAVQCKVLTESPWIASTFKTDTFAEEVSWDIAYLTGYLTFLDPTLEAAVRNRVIDYLKFLGFHHLSDGRAIADVYSNLTLGALPPPGAVDWKAFKSKYTWGAPTYLIDNHSFHPSLNYSFGVVGTAFQADNVLAKLNADLPEKQHAVVPTLSFNRQVSYDVMRRYFNRERLRNFPAGHPYGVGLWEVKPDCISTTTPLPTAETTAALGTADVPRGYRLAFDAAYSGTYIQGFWGSTAPSGVEDWGVTYPVYSITETAGVDYNDAAAHAKQTYYLNYDGAGLLFCVPGGSCTFGDGDIAQYQPTFANALYALLLSRRSGFR